MVLTLAELEAEVLRGYGAGLFFRNLRNPKTLSVYNDFTRKKQTQLDTLAGLIGHATPVPQRIFGSGEETLLKSEARFAEKLLGALDEELAPEVHLGLSACLRLQLSALSDLSVL